MTWKVENGDFVRVPQLPQGTRYVNRTLNEWVARITPRERERVLGVLFDILRSTGCESFSDMAVHWRESLPAIGEAVKDMAPSDRRLVVTTFKVLFSTALRTARTQAEEGVAVPEFMQQMGQPRARVSAADRDAANRDVADRSGTGPLDAEDEKRRIKQELSDLSKQYRDVKRLNKHEAQLRKQQIKSRKRQGR